MPELGEELGQGTLDSCEPSDLVTNLTHLVGLVLLGPQYSAWKSSPRSRGIGRQGSHP